MSRILWAVEVIGEWGHIRGSSRLLLSLCFSLHTYCEVAFGETNRCVYLSFNIVITNCELKQTQYSLQLISRFVVAQILYSVTTTCYRQILLRSGFLIRPKKKGHDVNYLNQTQVRWRLINTIVQSK